MKISVIIPTYNRAKTILEAINSVLNQTVLPYEILICDDGSTDNTKDLVLGLSNPIVKWLECGRNGRPAIPRNIGIKNATGDFIAFLDSDDVWHPDKLQVQIDALTKSNCLAVCANAKRFIPSKGLEGNLLNLNKTTISFNDLLFANSIICSSVIIEKKVFDKVYGFPEEPKFKAIEDYALWLRILTLSNFAYIDEPLLNYTDDVVNSIRGVQALDNLYEIRLLVLENYINWSEKAKINLSFLKKAKFHFWYYSKNKQNKLTIFDKIWFKLNKNL
ncbi:MAG: hypothetical protein A2086_15530 [Spirochaetes bacterium GWD1_27_9]|nr:MAG: hypothetical protein A2Z98_14975 [Spirochaetes bacterium GWB1_27_13]OHD23530.1 MAG: hypothetical protein A2Y34_05005 [Spirochaetes bacterium GWC1_27_15]OHD42793.1 MAG: hypothetical protein A2086_15530 [Spirochaetes bacterium GWD1_27_9]